MGGLIGAIVLTACGQAGQTPSQPAPAASIRLLAPVTGTPVLMGAPVDIRGEYSGSGIVQVRPTTCNFGCTTVAPALIAGSYLWQQAGNRISRHAAVGPRRVALTQFLTGSIEAATNARRAERYGRVTANSGGSNRITKGVS